MARTGKLTSLVAEEDVKLSQRRSLSTETADKLRELILLEKLPPGMHIPERDLSEALGISRTPMRRHCVFSRPKALSITRRRGARVSPILR